MNKVTIIVILSFFSVNYLLSACNSSLPADKNEEGNVVDETFDKKDPDIIIDFAKPISVTPMGGQLESWSSTQPSDDKIKPIMAGGEYARNFLWYQYPEVVKYEEYVKRGISLGYKMIGRLDYYPYQSGFWLWRYNDDYESYVRAMARLYGKSVIYDVFNEPNSIWWPGTLDQYLETYVRTYNILKEELGSDVLVTGPSFDAWDEALSEHFLDYCLEHNVKVPIFNYHDFYDMNKSTDGNVISSRLKEARKLIEKEKYKPLGIQKLLICEAWRHENAGDNLSVFAALEAGGADGAINSCFDGDCEKETLSGLLDNDNAKSPRSSWHVWKAYADGVKSRVSSVSVDLNIPGLGSSSVRGKLDVAQILVGNNTADNQNVKISIKNLEAAGLNKKQVKVSIYKLLDSNRNASSGFEPAGSKRYNVANGGLEIGLNSIPAQAVYCLYLE